MWWKIPIALGVGTGVGVGLQGGSLGRSLGWAALTTGLTSVLSSGRTWRAAWAGTRWAAPYVARVGVYAVSDIGIMGTAFTTTRTAAALGSGATVVAAVGVGYTVGAVTGTRRRKKSLFTKERQRMSLTSTQAKVSIGHKAKMTRRLATSTSLATHP